ncbi:MAG: family 16 glycosylhydrolase [Ignavibacteriaceae bacterium]|nr:family 16 glycosylhydrolase [Ignavibacteriaceae bacterium]
MKNTSLKAHLLIAIILSSLSIVSANDYRGAEYRTKEEYIYGRFEVRLKAPYKEGMLASFFTYWTGGEGIWNEIDVEVMARYNDNVQFNVITPTQSGNHVAHYPMSNPTNLDYHIYAFEWTPQYVAWFVDGVLAVRQMGEHIQTLTKPQKIMMNVWPPQWETWAGVLNPLSLPAFAYYDWVSYYSYTPGTGNYGTGNNFTHSWTDNFDSWDTTKWDKATHTWGGNKSDFIQENAVFHNGNLILCLTDKINIGYTDVTPPSISYARAAANKVTVVFTEEVDQTMAEDETRYFISGVTINNAVLQEDLKTVELSVSGLTIPSTNNLIVLSMKDRAPVPNTSGAKLSTLIMPQPLTFPIKINCGGSADLDYLADIEFSKTTEYGFFDGTATVYPSTLSISGTDEDAIYQAERYNMVGYKVRVPNGKYNVKLLFAEKYYNSAGSRVFDVYIEGSLAIKNLDVFAQVGKNAACIKEITNINVTDEELDIQFADLVNSAFISGIIITVNTTGVLDEGNFSPDNFKVEQNYPNPFNGKTTINFSLKAPDNINFGLFNALGQEIFFKQFGQLPEGNHQYILDTDGLTGTYLPSGIYFYVFTSSTKKETRKLVLLN